MSFFQGVEAGPVVRDNVPAWAADAVWYQIFPERFRNGDPTNDPTRNSLDTPSRIPASWRVSRWTADWFARDDWEQQLGADFYRHGVFARRYGGDLRGVIDKLDYLRGLGVNALYFNPVFYARSMHKYDGASFHHIDPHFGPDPAGDLALIAGESRDPATWKWTAADRLFLELLREAKARGMRVIIDGVFNHTGRDFFAFADLKKRQRESEFRDWYRVIGWDDPRTGRSEFDWHGWAGHKALPVFARNSAGDDLHPGPKSYVWECTRRWMDPDGDGDPSDGIDGWRLDVAEELPIRFWASWNRHVRKLNPQAFTVGEVWGDASAFIRDGGFSAVMNYHGFAVPVKGFLVDGAIDADRFVALLDKARGSHSQAVARAMQNLVDSHDTDRIASMIVNRRTSGHENPERFDYDAHPNTPRNNPGYLLRKPDATDRQIQKLVALFQATYVGAPMIYYGTEAGMWGADDPDDRMPMLWEDLDYEAQALDPLGRERAPDPVRFDPELFGFYQSVFSLRSARESLRTGDFRVLLAEDRLLAFSRSGRVVVAINRGESPATPSFDLPRGFGRARVVFSCGGGEMAPEPSAGKLRLSLPPLSAVVLVDD